MNRSATQDESAADCCGKYTVAPLLVALKYALNGSHVPLPCGDTPM